MLYWEFSSDTARAHGALPPELADFDYGRRAPHDAGLKGLDLQRAYLRGRQVLPSDCPPVRRIAGYGVVVRSPGAALIERDARPARERTYLADGWSSFGECRVSGDPWPEGDSGFVASWLSGSEYVKIQIGIRLYFPASMNLLQTPPPNPGLLSQVPAVEVMAGLEYPIVRTAVDINGLPHAVSVPNVIVKLPPAEHRVSIRRGDLLAWMVLVPKSIGLTPR